jgi:hypothetical protein
MSARCAPVVGAKVEQMRQLGRVEFDLSVSPSRAEAGLADGRSEVVYELVDRGHSRCG